MLTGQKVNNGRLSLILPSWFPNCLRKMVSSNLRLQESSLPINYLGDKITRTRLMDRENTCFLNGGKRSIVLDILDRAKAKLSSWKYCNQYKYGKLMEKRSWWRWEVYLSFYWPAILLPPRCCLKLTGCIMEKFHQYRIKEFLVNRSTQQANFK